MQTNLAAEHNKNIKNIKSSDSPWNQAVGEEKVKGGFAKKPSSEWKTGRVREDESGESEDGEDDELPRMIGESEGHSSWRDSRRLVGSSFHWQDAAYRKERLVILKEDRVGGREE